MSKFYERFADLCAKKDVSHSRAAMDIGLSNAAASGWADGNRPRDTTLRKLAAYFDVPLEYLKCEEEQKENPTVQMDSEVDERINDMWGQLTPQEREYFFSQIKDYLKMRGQ